MRDAERLRAGVEDAARRRHVLERAVAAIAKQPAGLAAIRLGRAVRLLLAVEAAEHVVLGRPLDVVADEQVEQPVAVEVEPDRRRAERLRPPSPLALRDIDERALAGVAKQAVLPDAGHQDIRESRRCSSRRRRRPSRTSPRRARRSRDVGERAVAIVAIERQRRPLRSCARASPCR